VGHYFLKYTQFAWQNVLTQMSKSIFYKNKKGRVKMEIYGIFLRTSNIID
jgi:hypothetical protein